MRSDDSSYQNPEKLEPDLRRMLESFSNRGRAAFLRTGISPIEQLVADAPAEYQELIFIKLLIDEAQLRQAKKDSLSLTEYKGRFPDRIELVDKAWREIERPDVPSTCDVQNDPLESVVINSNS